MKINFKIVFVLMLGILSAGSALAQTYGNEWIVATQSYYKIPVGRTGIYGLSKSDLPIAATAVSPKTLQIWRRGVQQAIFVKGESDGTFDLADSLFFFGEKNDGELDTQLYLPGKQPHKYYSLYSDTSAYFLTWTTSGSNGKRMPQLNITATAQPAAPYHINEELLLYTNSYDRGKDYSLETYLAEFDEGEGWFGDPLPASQTVTITTNNVYSSGPLPALEIMFAGRNINSHTVEISIGSFKDTIYFSGHSIYKFNSTVAFSNLNPTDISITFRPLGGLVSLAYIKFNYPQAFDMQSASEKFLNLPLNVQDTTFISLSNPAVTPYVFDITYKDSIRLIGYNITAGKLNAKVPNTSIQRRLFISSSILSASVITAVDLSAYSTAGNYIIIYHSKLDSSSAVYAAYRSSPDGGGHHVVRAEINKLYNLFSYGEKCPFAIRHFARYLLDNDDPKYLLLLGKGIYVNSANNANGAYYRKDPVAYKTVPDPYYFHLVDDLIPPAGYPGSDILFTMGLNSSEGAYIPAIPTGRVAARNNTEVINYLNKVIEHEGLDSNMLWRKNLIHLSGGNDAAQISAFKGFVTGTLKPIAEGPYFGGKVIKTFSKESSNTVDDNFRLSVSDEINKGVSYVTFLGHSSPAITDIDIGFVSYPIYGYQNKGKYPLLLMNGCSSSNLFNYYSFSEDWVVTADKGAIAVIGHTDIGYPYQLESYSQYFYQTSFVNKSFMNKPIGDIQKQVLKQFAVYPGTSDQVSQATIQQMILHGDPFVKIYPITRPDYSISENLAEQQVFVKSYNGQPVTAVSDSFAIGMIVSNFGQAAPVDSFAVTVTRTINSKSTVVYGPVWYPAIYYKDTIYFNIKSKDVSTFGDNVFVIKVDALDSIAEMSESNNYATLNFYMPLSGIVALLPYEYSIVNSAYLGSGGTVTLVAQSTDLLIDPVDYYFEIDTSYLFTSALKKYTTINAGSLARWTTDIIDVNRDSVVYYWRARYDQIPAGQDTLWGESSFIYIGGSPEGWSQSEYPQFTKDNLSHIVLDVPQKEWRFETVETRINVESMGALGPDSTNIILNGTPNLYHSGGGCSQQGIIAMTFDKSTALLNQPGTGLGWICGKNGIGTLRAFVFTNQFNSGDPAANQSALIDYIDTIPDGNYILLVANGPGFFSSWDVSLKNKFKTALGSTLIDSMTADYAYVILARKGSYPLGGGGPLPAFERFSKTGKVALDTIITGSYSHGTITSTLIGPTSEWGSMFRDIRTPDPSDSYTLKVERIGLDGSTKDISTIPAFGYRFDLDSFFHTLSDTSLFPYIRLIAEVSDSAMLTPPQLDKWQVVYRAVPEGTLDPIASGNMNQYKSFIKSEGENVPLSFVFQNISKINFPDSVRVRFTITNESGHTLTDYITLIPIQQGQAVTFNYTINSFGFVGKNVFQVFVNPKLQPEQYFDNNILEIFFSIEKDITNPILDVAFDGQHIMNGDIVSPSPLISINLNDENKFLIKNSTQGMEIFLQRPGQITPDQVSMTSSEIVSSGHVAGTNNTFRIEYHPQNLPDGIYTLIVQGTDSSGNKSASMRYEIKFEVINEASISYFYPYPNPFSSSTRFVFTLTGNEIPEDMKIQIMTVTGKVIREITKSEIGPIHIGNNKTEYAWDGTDEFGDRLANGVYLYRVILKGADDFKHRETSGDHSFKKTWGKLYILR